MNPDRIIAVRNNKTVYRDGDLCIKVFGESFSKSDIFGEAFRQATAEKSGLLVPKIREITSINGKWAIVSDYVKGQSLSEITEDNPEKVRDCLDIFVDLQCEVHKKICPSLAKLRDKIKINIETSDLDKLTAYSLIRELAVLPDGLNLCHGDFTPANIIISDNGTPYILDWAHASQGNAAIDAAVTYLKISADGNEFSADGYLEKFCKKSQLNPNDVLKLIPVAAASEYAHANRRRREFYKPLICDKNS